MTDITTITVRYAQGTYVARVKGQKKTASCVYDAEQAAKSLARKLDLDASSMQVSTNAERDCLLFSAKPLRRLPAQWTMVPVVPTIAMAEAGKYALAVGGTAEEVFAAMLLQAPSPEAWPPQGGQGVLDASGADAADQSEAGKPEQTDQ